MRPKFNRYLDETGPAVSVIVPIELWREIEAERETRYLLQSETMKTARWKQKAAKEAHPLRKTVKSFEFDTAAFEDLA